jgi:antitoxin (DNA-binding transcriptional repressor) of toxin-antitoxin stability system
VETLDVFSVRDLRTRSGDLLRDAELGQLALITKHGRPAILAGRKQGTYHGIVVGDQSEGSGLSYCSD